MIDAENTVFTNIAVALRSQFPGIYVTGELIPAPSSFPAVLIVEADNSAYRRTMDLAGTESHAIVMYQIEAVSNLQTGKKSQCKSIMAIVDEEMQKLGFVRIGNGPVDMPSIDAAIHRRVARYRAVIGKNGAIHRIT